MLESHPENDIGAFFKTQVQRSVRRWSMNLPTAKSILSFRNIASDFVGRMYAEVPDELAQRVSLEGQQYCRCEKECLSQTLYLV